MLKQTKLLLFLYVILSYGYLSAQVKGYIKDAQDQSALEYATVALYSVDSTLVSGVVTDENGYFFIEHPNDGDYYLDASFIGYQSKKFSPIQVRSARALDVGTIFLNSGQMALQEVVVQTERNTVNNRIDKQVFETKKFRNALGGSAAAILKNLPSVSVNGLGEISVRGTTGFVVLLNGQPVQGNAATLLNQLPANAVEQIEVITAPSAKYDPEGKAGILNIITKKGSNLGDFAQINIKGGFPSIENYGNAEDAHRYGIDATYNIQREKWNVSLGANYQRHDLAGRREGDVYTILNETRTQFPSDGERSFDEENYSGRFTVDFTPDTINTFSVGFYAGKRSKDRTADIVYFDNHAISTAEGGTRNYTFQYFNKNLRIRKSDFVLGSMDYTHQFKNTSKLAASFLYEYTLLGGPTTNRNLGYPDTTILYQDEYNTNDNPLNGYRFQLDYALNPWGFGQLELGYQYRMLDHKGDFIYERRTEPTASFELVPEFSSEVDLKRTIHAGYLQFTGQRAQWEYAVGVRIETMDRRFDLRDKLGVIDTTYTYDFVKPFPSASLQYTFKNRIKVKAAYSKRIERTTTFKMNPFPEREHSETLEQGDPTLTPEFIDLVELGVSKNLGKGNSIFATSYYRKVKNVVNRVNTIYNDTILNRIYSNVGDARSLGLELGAQIKPTEKWSNFIGFNIYDHQINGSFDGEKIATNSTVFSLNTNSTYAFTDTASLQFTFNYLSAKNTAQGEDSEFFAPNLSFRKSFLDNRLVATLQWQNIDLGLLNTNEQRITTFRPGAFFTTTNYVYEVDMVFLNLSYSFNKRKNKSRFIESEFGKREF
ncbi:TonB-dependent receptor domain-containing protein [Flavobacterium sp. ASW18X]|uniref:TonB-dependent receptor domain-containing protein n=1 Tax=Flavobacterium sp. ASW18X TaxID=2572595 RepID=UPI0010AE3F73|nr:TonB-dependent receptor [Flavobacterium sp. ASW18X]TKD67306.1 TonB-dependent receptor [Flavobacterium sp. ASW18X]